MSAGGSAETRSEASRRAAARLRQQAAWREREAEAFETGAAGERATAEALDALDRSYVCLHDRRMPGTRGNIDHIVVGPTGVFVVDTKRWSGTVEVDGCVLLRNGRSCDPEVHSLQGQALAAAAALQAAGTGGRVVRPALCLAGAAQLAAPVSFERVRVLNLADLTEWITRGEHALTPDEVQRFAECLDRAFPAYLPVREGLASDAPAGADVVFLTRWEKHGRLRYYAKDWDGTKLGHLDVRAGTSHPHGDGGAVLELVAPHYLYDFEEDDEPPKAMQFLRRLFGRAAAPAHAPVLVALGWRRHGKHRVYVKRIEHGSATDVGWYDVDRDTLGDGDDPTIVVLGRRLIALGAQAGPRSSAT